MKGFFEVIEFLEFGVEFKPLVQDDAFEVIEFFSIHKKKSPDGIGSFVSGDLSSAFVDSRR